MNPISATAVALSLIALPASAATVLIDYDDGDAGNGVHDVAVLDGDFSLALTNLFAPWQSVGTNADQVNTSLPSGVGSTANNVVATGRSLAVNTGYTIQAGATFDLSFMWRDASGWDDTDTVSLLLYYTDDNTIKGSTNNVLDPVAVTGLLDFNSGQRATLATWETVMFTGAGFADANAIGKNLFLRIVTNDASASEFARLDNVFLQVVPEPSVALLGGLGLFALLCRRR